MPSRINLEDVAAYYRALGEFVDTFANVEEVMFLYLSALAGVDHDTARAVFSGVRIRDAISYIKRISEVRGVQLAAELDDVLGQLQIINDVRNLILHHPASEKWRSGRLVQSISNVGRALTAERIKEIPISAAILMDMKYDLFRIQVFLFHEFACLTIPEGERDAIDRLGPVQVGAWLYKPAQQPRARQANHIRPRSRRPRERGE
jgi:hypothetical protein